MAQTVDQWLDGRDAARGKREAATMARREKRETAALPMVGELCREGKTMFYVWPVGGRYFESAQQWECVDSLIRNNYA